MVQKNRKMRRKAICYPSLYSAMKHLKENQWKLFSSLMSRPHRFCMLRMSKSRQMNYPGYLAPLLFLLIRRVYVIFHMQRMLFDEKVICFPTFLSSPQNMLPPSILDETGWVNFASENLFECHFVITEGIPLQGIRITARNDKIANWNLHEVWIRQQIQL